MGWRRRDVDEEESVLPDGLWEYLQPYIAEEAAPSLEWAVRRPDPALATVDLRAARTRLAPVATPAS